MVLGKVIRLVGRARLPVDSEFALLDSISDPVEPHVHGFRALRLDSFVGDAFGGGVVGLDRCGAFFLPSHFF